MLARATPAPSTSALNIGLVNNMPDAALEATEQQFAALLADADTDAPPVLLKLYSLPEIAREGAAAERIATHYRPWSALWNDGLDALIVTGAEPKTPRLDGETYWPSLAQLIDRARHDVVSSIWSCLAAHAAVLHLDGIERRRLADKCFGVHQHEVTHDHPLTDGTPPTQAAPHSRWNELPRDALERCGYRVLTAAPTAGVNLFVKDADRLLVFWQGHPEYEDRTLLKEYQRDVLRYLRGERETYPGEPAGYFDAPVRDAMAAFRERALITRDARLIREFPFEMATARVRNTWRGPARAIYRNWLRWVADRRSTGKSIKTIS